MNRDPSQAEIAAEFIDAHIQLTSAEAERARIANRNSKIISAAGYAVAAAGIGLEFRELEHTVSLNELYAAMGGVGLVAGIGAHINAGRNRLRNSRLVKRLKALTGHKESVESVEPEADEDFSVADYEKEISFTREKIELEKARANDNTGAGATLLGLAATASGGTVFVELMSSSSSTNGGDTNGAAVMVGIVSGMALIKGLNFLDTARYGDDRIAQLETEGILLEYDLMRSRESGQAA